MMVLEREKKTRGGMGTGMAHFYRKLLDDSEQNHEQTVAATSSKPVIGPQGPTPNLTITKPADFTPKSDLELARIAREGGKEVELNDDNQIVDKRELLTAGLNLAAPNTRKFGLQTSKAKESDETATAHRAVGTAASRREINERRAREIEKQMDEERERMLQEKESREQERVATGWLRNGTTRTVYRVLEIDISRGRGRSWRSHRLGSQARTRLFSCFFMSSIVQCLSTIFRSCKLDWYMVSMHEYFQSINTKCPCDVQPKWYLNKPTMRSESMENCTALEPPLTHATHDRVKLPENNSSSWSRTMVLMAHSSNQRRELRHIIARQLRMHVRF